MLVPNTASCSLTPGRIAPPASVPLASAAVNVRALPQSTTNTGHPLRARKAMGGYQCPGFLLPCTQGRVKAGFQRPNTSCRACHRRQDRPILLCCALGVVDCRRGKDVKTDRLHLPVQSNDTAAINLHPSHLTRAAPLTAKALSTPSVGYTPSRASAEDIGLIAGHRRRQRSNSTGTTEATLNRLGSADKYP